MTKSTALRPVRPNAGIEAAYRRRLLALIDAMHRSVVHWLTAAYKRHPPVMAQDQIPTDALHRIIRRLTRRWLRNFAQLADDLARYFATNVAQRSDAALKAMFKRSGFTVEFQVTPAMRDVMHAVVKQNVSLIRSIPQQHLAKVEQSVLQSVQTGRDLHQLSNDLQQQFGVTKRRAALIARDQNNKATAALQRVRQMELGIKRAVWMHSGAGRYPRWQHIAMNGKEYSIEEGMWDPVEKRHVHPGELISCRCASRIVLTGLAGARKS